MPLVKIECDLCGSSAFELMHSSTIPDPEIAPHLYFSSSRERAGYLDIVRCRECGLVMTNPRDDAQTIASVYSRLEDRVYQGEVENRQRTAHDHLRWIQRHVQPPGKLLDVGCATGIFLEAAHNAGWQTTGIEPSIWAAEQAQLRVRSSQIVLGGLEDVDLQTSQYQVVTAWDVLEHVQSPTAALYRLRNWLAPDGMCFLNLPNASSLVARLSGAHWILLLREHLWYFSPDTIQKYLEKTGFELVHTQPNTVWFSLENVFSRIAQYPGLPQRIGRALSSTPGLKDVSIKFPMGEINVAARKK